MSKSGSESTSAKVGWFGRLSLKAKLLGALCALMVLNSAYFYFGASSVSEMNKIVLSLYDKVVMAGIYSQMAKNDFARYSEEITLAVDAVSEDEHTKILEKASESATTLVDDLSVVEERALAPEDKVSVATIKANFIGVQSVAHSILEKKTPKANLSALTREWLSHPERLKTAALLTELTDKIVADGYAYRLSSEERTGMIEKATYGFAGAVVFLNIVCMSFILLSILPHLRRLTRICAQITEGALDKRVSVRTKDEFGTLAVAFNSMLDLLAEREAQISKQLFTTNAMVDSLAQGFLIFDSKGTCLPVYSKACLDLLECAPAGLSLSQVLKIEESKLGTFNDWLEILFSGAGTFEDIAGLYPRFEKHSNGLTIALDYRALRDADDNITHVVLVATDKTEELRAKELADREQAFSKMVSKLAKNRSQFSRFLVEADKMIGEIPRASNEVALRVLHTIKGGAATFSIMGLKEVAHDAESDLAEFGHLAHDQESLGAHRTSLSAISTRLRAEYEKTLKELLEACAFMISDGGAKREVAISALLEFHEKLREKPTAASLPDQFVEDFILEPISTYFQPQTETLQELARRLSKRVQPLKIVGGDVKIYGDQYAELFATFVHAFRNAVDHGIEHPDLRAAAGKNPAGQITIETRREIEAGLPWLHIAIRDDGRGVDEGKLRAKHGAGKVEGKTDEDVLQHLFDAGVSTAETVTDVSGRGVGMDAIRSAAQRMGGSAEITSVLGEGTTVLIRVPERVCLQTTRQAA